MIKEKVMVAMSGGVDSSVAAAILQEKYDIIGVTLKLFANEDIKLDRSKTCCSLDDVEDARNVAFKLGFNHYVFNFGDKFKEFVIDKFNDSYINGYTPNPCIDCNRFIKFNALLRRAIELEQDYIATGHYVRSCFDESKNRYLLKKAVDSTKDQSYVLYGLTQEQLKKTLFPLGEMCKEQTREIADKLGLVNANKPDSQDICFVPDGDYAKFIEEYTNTKFPNGKFTDKNGKILGEHKGIIRYTRGQRKGLGIALGTPAYVLYKNKDKNTVVLGSNEDLFTTTFFVNDLNWISIDKLTEPMEVYVKSRYRHKEQKATIYPIDNSNVKVVYDEPQRAITTGQAAVFYDGDIVVGGGTIYKLAEE